MDRDRKNHQPDSKHPNDVHPQQQQTGLMNRKLVTKFSTTDSMSDADNDTNCRRKILEEPADTDIAKHTILVSPNVYIHKEPEANLEIIQREIGYQKLETGYDLTEGYGTTETPWIEENRNISLLLESLDRDRKVPKSGFVCHSGLLVELGLTGYNIETSITNFENFDKGMKFAVQKVGDVLYMYEFETTEVQPTDRTEKLNKAKKKKMEYAGRRMESYIIRDSQIPTTGGDRTFEKHLNPNLEFNVVYQAELGTHTLIYKSEIDACLKHGDEYMYIEIKAAGDLRDITGDVNNFVPLKYKQLRWRLQTHLAGVKNIVVGDLVPDDQDDHFYTRNLYGTIVTTITKDVLGSETQNATFDYIMEVLNTVSQGLANQDLQTFVFTRDPGEKWFHCEKSDSKFLPYWFVKKYRPQK